MVELQREPLSRDNPWPGLDPFDETDREYFHGRAAESGELLRLVRREPLTVVFGRSGLGKTSLLKAGLFPLLRGEDCLDEILGHIGGHFVVGDVEGVAAEDDRLAIAGEVLDAVRAGGDVALEHGAGVVR